jgi:hypothetical protein
MPLGKCPMCLRLDEDLQDSHYLPKSAYKGFRATSLKNPNPIVVNPERMDQSSWQVHDYLLCRDCEQDLNKNGENWVIPMLAGASGFPFFDLIKIEIPALSEPDFNVYACSKISGIAWNKLAHFGVGMFWKGAVHTWSGCPKINLGKYVEEIRKYLRNEAPFPRNVALIVQVVASEEPPWTARPPIDTQAHPYHLFNFYLRGIDFTLAVGKQIPEHLRHLCLFANPVHPVIASAGVGLEELKLMKGLVERSKPSRKLAEFLRGPNPRHKKL